MHENENSAEFAADLVSRIRSGDRSAEDRLYQSYQSTILYLLRRKTKNSDAFEDLGQETFRIALEQIRQGRIHQPEKLAAFLYGIALNVFRKWDRSNRARRFQSVDDPVIAMNIVSKNRNPHEKFRAKEKQKTVIELIMGLKARDREVLVSLFLNEESPDEVCRRLSLTRKNLSLILWRARQRLKRKYAESAAAPARAS